MKRKFVLVGCIIIAVICVFYISLKFNKQVPESIISEYIYNDLIPSGKIISVNHNYNSDTHIDSVTVITNEAYEYGTVDSTYFLEYQYYVSDDLWELMGESKTNEIHWDEEKLENGWTGEDKDDNSLWQVDIIDFDFINQKVTLSYSIRYFSRAYYNNGEPIRILFDHNVTYDLYAGSDIPISKEDNNGIVRDITIDYDLTKGIDVYT